MSAGAGTPIVKRSVVLAGHRTSVSVEGPFWDELRGLAARRGVSVNALVAEIDAARRDENLSSAIRLTVLASLQADRQGEAG